MEGGVVRKNISLYGDDWAVLEQVAEAKRIRSLSGAIRFVLSEWMAMNEFALSKKPVLFKEAEEGNMP